MNNEYIKFLADVVSLLVSYKSFFVFPFLEGDDYFGIRSFVMVVNLFVLNFQDFVFETVESGGDGCLSGTIASRKYAGLVGLQV
jgi:hypothetical protein